MPLKVPVLKSRKCRHYFDTKFDDNSLNIFEKETLMPQILFRKKVSLNEN